MRTLYHTVAGDECTIFVPESLEDMRPFTPWLEERQQAVLAVDTETTGLNVFGAGFGLRLLQIGDTREAWVIRVDLAEHYGAKALRQHNRWVSHNWSYDAPVIERALGVRIEELTPKMYDTIILSRLINPARENHKLKPLSEEHVDQWALDTQDGLMAEFHRLGFTKDTGWANIPYSNELYNRYAGLDVIYTARLLVVLGKLAKQKLLDDLVQFEHTIQGYLNMMRRKGLRVDMDYARQQREVFLGEAADHLRVVQEDYGLDNLNSPKQVVEALQRSGAELTVRTPSGAFKAGKEVLLPLAGLDEYWEEIEEFENPNPLALHIAKGKRAERFANAYLGKFMNLADPDNRIHPSITGLQARTSRMAVSDPPLQQLPSKDWKVRRAILADPGQVIVSADYAQIEMRLVAAMAGIRKMKEAIENGLDLHGYTAELAYGPGYTKQNRVHMKGAGFGIVYGGGAKGLAPKLGISLAQATAVVKAYNRVYPEIKRYSTKLQRKARQNGMEMRSPTGRILTLDRDRMYAAINYQVQSTAADVMKNAVENLWNQGLGDHLLMPVHDEIIAQADRADADDVARAIAEAMKADVMDMHLDTDAEVYGPSWGHGYTNDDAAKQALAAYDYTLDN